MSRRRRGEKRKKHSGGGEEMVDKSRRVLTIPGEPAGNGGHDNVEHNLIVRENDHLKNRYKVVNLLGKGVYGIVLGCVDLGSAKGSSSASSGVSSDNGPQKVAIKIIKNHPDFHRQAKIEVQILRLLMGRQGKRIPFKLDLGRKLSLRDRLATSKSPSVDKEPSESSPSEPSSVSDAHKSSIVELLDVFSCHGHLCIVFELLGPNLYEVVAARHYVGIGIDKVRVMVRQCLRCLVTLRKKNVIHCDLKPENILMVKPVDKKQRKRELIAEWKKAVKKPKKKSKLSPSDDKADVAESGAPDASEEAKDEVAEEKAMLARLEKEEAIRIIDFGSACFAHLTTSWYIQSRFYRAPEVLLGHDYDAAIDMWSLGCIAAEMFLGLPLFPGLSAYDQIFQIVRVLGVPPVRMIETGQFAGRYFRPAAGRRQYVLKPEVEYSRLMGAEAKGTKIYFPESTLENIILYCGGKKGLAGAKPSSKRPKLTPKQRNKRLSMADFLSRLLTWDPQKRLDAAQAQEHPFVTGEKFEPGCFRPSPSWDTKRSLRLSPPEEPVVSPAHYSMSASIAIPNSRKRGGLAADSFSNAFSPGSYIAKPPLGSTPTSSYDTYSPSFSGSSGYPSSVMLRSVKGEEAGREEMQQMEAELRAKQRVRRRRSRGLDKKSVFFRKALGMSPYSDHHHRARKKQPFISASYDETQLQFAPAGPPGVGVGASLTATASGSDRRAGPQDSSPPNDDVVPGVTPARTDDDDTMFAMEMAPPPSSSSSSSKQQSPKQWEGVFGSKMVSRRSARRGDRRLSLNRSLMHSVGKDPYGAPKSTRRRHRRDDSSELQFKFDDDPAADGASQDVEKAPAAGSKPIPIGGRPKASSQYDSWSQQFGSSFQTDGMFYPNG